MTQKIKTFILTSVAALSLFAAPLVAGVVSPSLVSADIQDCLTQGSELKGNLGETCDGTPGGSGAATDLTDVITTVVNIISILVGVLAVIMIIFGGLKYITSGGDSNKITSAKNTIIYALIGLVIVALAQFIVRFVLSKAGEIA